jgi:LPXTG-motif cell wall-anchored protein
MKTIAVIWMLLILAVGLALPAHAQGTMATLEFRVTVEGTPCPNATYWAILGVPDSEGFGVQLLDPDGDAVYTGSTTAGVGNQLFVSLVQGTGTQETVFGPVPGEPSTTMRDFGLVTVTGDMVFEGHVSGCPAGLPDTGSNDGLPVVPIAGGVLLAGGAYLRRRVGQRA